MGVGMVGDERILRLDSGNDRTVVVLWGVGGRLLNYVHFRQVNFPSCEL